MQRPVKPSQYDANWITNAWGLGANAELLRSGTIQARPRIDRAMQLAAIRPGIRLLDIACGRGEAVAITCQTGGFGVGVDYSAASLDFAKQVQSVHASESDGNMTLARADATHLPFSDASFDRVTLLDIIEHLYDGQLEAMFKEVRRVLKSDGYAVLHTLPNRWVYDITFPILHGFWRKCPRNPRSAIEKGIHVNEQDLFHLHDLLQRCQFRHKIWLEQHIPAQARWSASRDRFADQRGAIYPLLAKWPGKLLELLSYTPFKLLLCNDIFGLIWKHKPPPACAIAPFALTEKLLLLAARQHP